VFLGRITPIVRSFVSIPAGVFQHPLPRYTLLTFIGSTIWCLAFACIGWAVGENWESFHHAFRYVEYAVAGLIVVGLGYLVLRWRSSRLNRRASDSSL
jgi:membrane protein DedA with SNARE-associated domain